MKLFIVAMLQAAYHQLALVFAEKKSPPPLRADFNCCPPFCRKRLYSVCLLSFSLGMTAVIRYAGVCLSVWDKGVHYGGNDKRNTLYCSAVLLDPSEFNFQICCGQRTGPCL